MKIWLNRGCNLYDIGRGQLRFFPMGTCLFVTNDAAPKGMAHVTGGGAYDIAPLEWLSLSPITL